MADILYKKQLSELLAKIVEVAEIATHNYDLARDITISHLTLDSRKVRQGSLFFACSGSKLDGRNYIDDAISRGAVAIFVEMPNLGASMQQEIPIFYVPNLRNLIGKIAAKFYDYPSRHMTVIGITGTNGKTSCSQFIAQLLQAQQVKCGIIGTIGVGYPDKLESTINTTPDPITLQSQLACFYCDGAKAVAMEVSSHSLVQDRVQGVEFKIAVFTNLTRDHLDYHQDMEQYGLAKKKLFMQPSLKFAVINADDDFGLKLIDEFSHKIKVYAYTLNDESTKVPVIKAQNIQLSSGGISAHIVTPWGDDNLTSVLLGRFNLSNLLAVLGVLGVMNLDIKSSLASIANLKPPPGRMQAIGSDGRLPLIVIDYAHTPDALEKALTALREHCQGALWCVFGCGGEKDRGKRPMMGQIAERYSDHVIITDDNPRHENSQQIVDDIVAGLLCPWAVEIEHDRRIAITHVLNCAKATDVVLIAGKGHENYQIIGSEKIPFNDEDAVKAIINY